MINNRNTWMNNPFKGIVVLLLAFLLCTPGSAEALTDEDAVAYTSNYNGTYNYYATLDEALTAVQPYKHVYLLKDASVSPDILANYDGQIDGKGKSITVDAGSAAGNTVELSLNGAAAYYYVHLKSSDADKRLSIKAAGDTLRLYASTVEGTVAGTKGTSLFLDENCTVDAVKGNGYVMIGGTLRADYVEGAAVSLHYADFICTAKENIGFIFRVHNDNPDATRTFSASRTTIHCEKETFDLLKENTPEGDGLPAVKLDNPVRLNTMGLGDVKLTDELAFLFPDREGEELMFFGYGSSGTAPEAFDTYCIQYGKPVSVECKTSADIIKLYNKGDSFNYYFTWANVTWMSGNHRYTETYRGVTSLGYDFQSGIKIEGVDSADKITGEPLVMVWAPVDGVRLTSPVMDVKGYYLLEKTAEIKRVYGTHKDEYCRVTFNETATAASGTVYEDQSSEKYRIEKGGSAVFTVDVAEGYEVHKVEAANCTVKQTGANEYTLSNIQGDTRISVHYDAHEYEHDVTMVNGAHGFVDLEETNLLTIGAEEGYYVQAVIVNGKDLGQVNKLRLTCDSKIVVVFSKIGETADISKYISSGNTESGTGSSSGTSVSKEKLIAGIKATTIKASTVNVVGTKIRVNWKKSAGYKVDYYQIFRSTKRNSGYGTKPIYTTKTGKATSYTNSKNLKVGTRYYYKVRGVRVIDGKKYYTKWSNKANRTARYTPQASGKY